MRGLNHREAQRRYQKTPRGRETERRYRQSPLGRETQYRYRHSPLGRECQYRYRHSPKGRERNWRFDNTPARVQYKREWARAYRKTALYKERQLDRHYKLLDALFRELSTPGRHDLGRLEQYYRLQNFLRERELERLN